MRGATVGFAGNEACVGGDGAVVERSQRQDAAERDRREDRADPFVAEVAQRPAFAVHESELVARVGGVVGSDRDAELRGQESLAVADEGGVDLRSFETVAGENEQAAAARDERFEVVSAARREAAYVGEHDERRLRQIRAFEAGLVVEDDAERSAAVFAARRVERGFEEEGGAVSAIRAQCAVDDTGFHAVLDDDRKRPAVVVLEGVGDEAGFDQVGARLGERVTEVDDGFLAGFDGVDGRRVAARVGPVDREVHDAARGARSEVAYGDREACRAADLRQLRRHRDRCHREVVGDALAAGDQREGRPLRLDRRDETVERLAAFVAARR